MSELYLYEQPLNEKTRSFLRLEKLFKKFSFHLAYDSEWNNRVSIDTLLDILTYSSRGDIKREILTELDSQYAKLRGLAGNEKVDSAQLAQVLSDIEIHSENLRVIKGKVGQQIKNIELLSSISQKSSIPGIICDFDLPALKYWLSTPKEQRKAQLECWFQPFLPMMNALRVLLSALRQSTKDTHEIAQSGFFQDTLNAQSNILLLGVSFEKSYLCYPEISAGKHRFSVRFMKNENPEIRPEQVKDDVSFFLKMYAI